jgi:hypothetical protein
MSTVVSADTISFSDHTFLKSRLEKPRTAGWRPRTHDERAVVVVRDVEEANHHKGSKGIKVRRKERERP